MKILFSESQSESLSQLFEKSIKKNGLQTVLYRYKLSMKDAIKLIGHIPVNNFDSDDLYELCMYFISRNKNYWNEGISDGDYRITFEIDSFVGTVNFLFESVSNENKLELHGMATPYWDSNYFVPIDFDNFRFKKDYDISGSYYEAINLKNLFENLGDIIQWLFKDYPFIVFEECLKVVEDMEENLHNFHS